MKLIFIPRVLIPNRLAYRSNLKESKELQRQVEDLLAKGHVRKRINPCVILVLLVPKKMERIRCALIIELSIKSL